MSAPIPGLSQTVTEFATDGHFCEVRELLFGAGNGSAHSFDRTSMAFGSQPALPGRRCRGCLTARSRLFGCFTDQLHQPSHRILAISFLRSEPPGVNDQYAVLRNLSAGQMKQTLANVLRKRGGMRDIEAKLNRRSNFVDILPPRSRGARKFLLNFVLTDGQGGCNLNHTSFLFFMQFWECN